MTREHKLTLIIAFAILLVVGVLVGDHFSKARHASPGVEVATNPTDALNVPTEPSNAPAAVTAAQAGPASGQGGMALTNGAGTAAAGTNAVLPPVQAVTGEEIAAANQPQANQPGANSTPGATTATTSATVPARTTTTISMVPGGTAGGNTAGANTQPTTTGNGAGARTGEQSPFVFIPEGVRNAPPAAGISTVPMPSGGGASGGNESAGAGTTKVGGGLPVSTGKLLAHPVEKGETLVSLARKFYNDATLAKKLAEFNKGKVGEKMSLRQGVTLRIPPKDVLLGQAVLPENASPELSNKKPDAATGSSTKPAGTTGGAGTAGTTGGNAGAENAGAAREYVVQKGDTLGQIASKLLGSSKRAREIVQLNRGVISDQDNLKVGTKLKIPAR